MYALLRLRVDVFVVEQECPYPELDGRDLEPTTEHVWFQEGDEVVAAVRVLAGSDSAGSDSAGSDLAGSEPVVVGRVVTRAGRRGAGLAADLVRAALETWGHREVRIGAQAHLEGWYEQFGFRRSGPDYLEDGIWHLPMVRPADRPPSLTHPAD